MTVAFGVQPRQTQIWSVRSAGEDRRDASAAARPAVRIGEVTTGVASASNIHADPGADAVPGESVGRTTSMMRRNC